MAQKVVAVVDGGDVTGLMRIDEAAVGLSETDKMAERSLHDLSRGVGGEGQGSGHPGRPSRLNLGPAAR